MVNSDLEGPLFTGISLRGISPPPDTNTLVLDAIDHHVTGKVLVVNNGAYGARIALICQRLEIDCVTIEQPEDEPVLYDEWDNATVERLLYGIGEIAAYMRHRNKPPRSVAIVVDDFAEIPQVVCGPQVTSLFLKGRHWERSTLQLAFQ